MSKLVESDVARQFRAELARHRRRRFVPAFHTGGLAADLRDLIASLDPVTLDPKTGITLIASFYRADARIFEVCDDSSGSIGGVFRLDASARFATFAARCDDPEWVAGVVQELVEQDDYGVRDALLDRAAEFLPVATLRALAGRLWEAATSAVVPRSPGPSKLGQMRRFLLVEQVARQLRDPELFERARRAWSPELGTAAYVDIARMWAKAADPSRALEWLERIEPGERFLQEERDGLLRELYTRLGRQAELVELLWRRLRECPSRLTLDELVAEIGEAKREGAVATMVAQLNPTEEFRVSDVEFLLDTGQPAVAVDHLVRLRDQISGGQWIWLLPLAERLMAAGEPLGATVLYRALLDDLLSRAQTRAYPHGARYLRQLAAMAPTVADRRGVSSHGEYLAGLRQRHGLKRTFWGLADPSG